MQKFKLAVHECIVCIPGRDDQSPPLADTHAEQPLVPAGDDLGQEVSAGRDGRQASHLSHT